MGGGGRAVWRDDAGTASSLAAALLAPVFVVLAFAAFQAAMWSHTKTEARVIARDAAGLVARSGVTAADAQASATAVLTSDTDLHDVSVVVGEQGGIVTVHISGEAPGIIRGTSSRVSVTAALPLEERTP
jgi:Flp pilus assembly protein TadG